MNDSNSSRKIGRKSKTKKVVTPMFETNYDRSLGVIKIIDTSSKENAEISISPIKLNRKARRNIKKPDIAKNLFSCQK